MMHSELQNQDLPVVLGVCGASGQIYARWALKLLLQNSSAAVHVVLSRSGRKVMGEELGVNTITEGLDVSVDRVRLHDDDEMADELASGSVPTRGMLICPCSLNTLAGLAGGLSDNLLKRAAQVHLKERRRLVVAVREMPLGLIDLENMVKLTQAGAVVTPISPPFYHRPERIEDLAAFTAQKLVQLVIPVSGGYRYCAQPKENIGRTRRPPSPRPA